MLIEEALLSSFVAMPPQQIGTRNRSLESRIRTEYTLSKSDTRTNSTESSALGFPRGGGQGRIIFGVVIVGSASSKTYVTLNNRTPGGDNGWRTPSMSKLESVEVQHLLALVQ